MFYIIRRVILCLCFGFSSVVYSVDYYVCPKGLDTNRGTLDSPFKTLAMASDYLKPGDTCYIRGGVYRETLTPYVSGREGAPITYKNYNNENVIISGADILYNWTVEDGNIYTTTMEWTLGKKNQLFFNGNIITEASWPAAGDDALFNPGRATILEKAVDKSFISREIPGTKEDWIGAKLWCDGGASWICWTGEVKDFNPKNGIITYTTPGYDNKYYLAKKGNGFVLKGVKKALHAPGQWLYENNSSKILIIPPKGSYITGSLIEAKRREVVINLNNRSFIDIVGLNFVAGKIVTNENSSNIKLDRLKGKYISHSYYEEDIEDSGIQITGNNISVLNCDFGYSSGPVLYVKGRDNKIINNYLHHGNYAGLWNGAVALSGRRQLFSHNTVEYSGRDLVTTHGLMESLVQYNDLSKAGCLTKDLGMMYGHNTDFANTQFRFNWVHDNLSKHLAMGIYFDPGSHNAIVYNNVVWNVKDNPINFNNPSYNNLAFNNSSLNSGPITTFGWLNARDMFSSRIYNNIFNKTMDLPKDVFVKNNLLISKPKYRDPKSGDFRLKNADIRNIGAYGNINKVWIPGCDLDNPPKPLPTYEPADIPWMNSVKNACFEFGYTEFWLKTGLKGAKIIKGNNWGNNWGAEDLHKTPTNKFELELSVGNDGIEQTIHNLYPDTEYTLSAWLRGSKSKNRVTLGVKDFGYSEKTQYLISDKWTRRVIKFKTGKSSTQATIFITNSGNRGKAWCDNIILPRTPKSNL